VTEPTRELLATIDGAPVGSLVDANGTWSFRYHPDWLQRSDAFDLSPHLPRSASPQVDDSSRRHVQRYFDNLLPEEAQRTLMARDARLPVDDAFALLTRFGAESAGSLTLLAPDEPTALHASKRALSTAELMRRIDQLPQIPLTHHAAKRMSLAGAQHKLAILVEDDGSLAEPAGAEASTHILKPDHPDPTYAHSVANEWFTMSLARELELDVPAVERRYLPAPVYLVNRFDRARVSGHTRRLHAIDGCQLLGFDPRFKYEAGRVERLADMAAACRSPAVARARLFDWLVFNVLVGNTDAHLKNLSFLVSNEGIRMAPFYDLLSTAVYDTRAFDRDAWPNQTPLAWPILDRRKLVDIDRDVMVEAAAIIGLRAPTAERRMDLQRERVLTRAETLLKRIDDENQKLLQATPELGPTLAGESRCLRAITHTVIRDMANQLARGQQHSFSPPSRGEGGRQAGRGACPSPATRDAPIGADPPLPTPLPARGERENNKSTARLYCTAAGAAASPPA
jgi:serine/threonine-protein kinase HipA